MEWVQDEGSLYWMLNMLGNGRRYNMILWIWTGDEFFTKINKKEPQKPLPCFEKRDYDLKRILDLFIKGVTNLQKISNKVTILFYPVGHFVRSLEYLYWHHVNIARCLGVRVVLGDDLYIRGNLTRDLHFLHDTDDNRKNLSVYFTKCLWDSYRIGPEVKIENELNQTYPINNSTITLTSLCRGS